jgi:hypothetical protein
MRFAELTEVETGIVYTFNTDKIRAVVRQPIPLVGKDGSPEWGPIATFVWGLDPGCFTHIPDDPEAFLERVGLSDQFIYLGDARCDDSTLKLWLRASGVTHLTEQYGRGPQEQDVQCYAFPGIFHMTPWRLQQSVTAVRTLLENAA